MACVEAHKFSSESRTTESSTFLKRIVPQTISSVPQNSVRRQHGKLFVQQRNSIVEQLTRLFYIEESVVQYDFLLCSKQQRQVFHIESTVSKLKFSKPHVPLQTVRQNVIATILFGGIGLPS